MRLAFDLEATGLLDSTTIDYTSSPYVLKNDFKIHCAVFLDIDTGVYYKFVQDECYTKLKPWLLDNATMLIGNNIIAYDLMVFKLALGIDFTVYPDTLGGKPCKIFDNMMVSKTLNPDRPGHSVDYYGSILGYPKIDWRSKAIELGLIQKDDVRGAEFIKYHPEMLTYNIRDTELSAKIYHYLVKEWGKWDWEDAVNLEQAVREIITRGEHRGFWFDYDLALSHVRDLDIKLEALRATVEPLIPPKPLGKTALKEYIPGSKQFKINGEPNTNIIKWVKKHGGELSLVDGSWHTKLYGKDYILPIPQEPIVTETPALIRDTTHLKNVLVSWGWQPTAYKERDLTIDSKKHKLSQEKFIDAVERYVEQTLSSPFKKDRLEHLEVNEADFCKMLLSHDITRPLRVLTNPTLTVGQDKEIDPKLLELSSKFAYAKEVSEWLTYNHRRNSILGGGVDPDDDDEDAEKGYLSVDRIKVDHRIPTPADTCGAGTSRFKHKICVNIPRVSSLYGKELRSLFGVDVKDGFLQVAYDFDSLEAKMESHHVFKYKGGVEYGLSLTAEKPNDCHSVLARIITQLIGKDFSRNTAKSVKYGCTYNAQAKRVMKIVGCDMKTAQIVFDAFWQAAAPLKELKEAMQKYWETTGQKKFLLGLDGRKLPIRSKGNVINTRFQSSGVICAKRAMVLHDRMLQKEGLIVDFFKDDWRNKNFCQQLIAMHDEAQCEVRRHDVEFKNFNSEEEAKSYKDPTGRIWSDVIKNDKGIYRAYNRAGELATIAVKQAGEYYNLNVELTAGYMVGTNWATCH